MKIVETRVLRGPNRHAFKPCLQAVLDLEDLDEVSSADLAGFTDRLVALLPTLHAHRCSPGHPGGFIERLREGTYMAHIAEHVALELQTLAGHDVGFGRARQVRGCPRHYRVVVSYLSERVAQAALELAVALVEAIAHDRAFDLEAGLGRLTGMARAEALGPSTRAIVDAARARGIPVARLTEEANLVQLGWGCRAQRIQATTTSRSNFVAVDIASDKALTKRLLEEAALPVPAGRVVTDLGAAVEAARALGWPVVVKPLDANQGKGVSTGVDGESALQAAFERARKWGPQVIVEANLAGEDYRVVVVGERMVAAARRTPPCVTGDGRSTVRALVEAVNRDPARGEGHECPLTRIPLDDAADETLAAQGLGVDAVPAAGRVVRLRGNANLSTGGMAEDVTDRVHPATARACIRAARRIGLDVAGIDLVCRDIALPLAAQGGALIEVNAAPGIRMHEFPAAGARRAVGEAIVDSLFPAGDDGRIPTVAVTGSNGKTTTTLAIGHALRGMGLHVGMTTTEGIWIGEDCVGEGDCTGYWSARTVLHDPDVEVAVLETARGGILKRGLAFDRCDVGVVLNVHADHLGQDGIETLEELAEVKGLVAETARRVAVLNADDPLCLAMGARLRPGCEALLFGSDARSEALRRHLAGGGRAVVRQGRQVVLMHGDRALFAFDVGVFAFTVDGLARHNVDNAMAAFGALVALGRSPADAARHLAGFACTVEQNAMRLNAFDVGGVTVLMDYAHNARAYAAIAETARALAPGRVVGVVAVPGDRRDDDLLDVGRTCGASFDRLVVYEMDDLRGREPGATARLLLEGALDAGIAPEAASVRLPVRDAVRQAVTSARPGDVVVFGCASHVEELTDAIGDLPGFTPARLHRSPAAQVPARSVPSRPGVAQRRPAGARAAFAAASRER